MSDYPFEIVDENESQVILKVNAIDALTVAYFPYISLDMAYITVTKGEDHTLYVINENGVINHNFSWGISGCTLINSRLEQLRKAVVNFIDSQFISLH